jgi:hypothetical protein
MTRVADRPLPPIVLDTDAFAGRPVRPVIAVQTRRPVAEWDDPALEWDTDPMLEWDMDQVPGFLDATCDMQGAEWVTGNPDDHWNFDTSQAVVQLSNVSGRWSRFDTNGKQSYNGPGLELAIWTIDQDGQTCWQFRGTITRYDDTTDTVTLEAFDAFAPLAQPIGTYTPGAAGQTAATRLAAVMAAAGRSALPARFATPTAGDVTLTAQATTAAPLEEMQSVASSDAGVLFTDADGALVYLRRNWRTIGRTDQTVIPVASDNVCTTDFVVWDAVLSNNDDGLANTVIFENVAHLRAVAPAGVPITGVVFTETDHQWTTQAEGDTIAAIVQGAHNDPRVNVEEFAVHLFAPGTYYTAARWRLLDTLRFLHDNHAVDGTIRLDVNTLVSTISHDVTADAWVMTVGTSKAMSSTGVLVWNPAADAYVWDTAGAVWGF